MSYRYYDFCCQNCGNVEELMIEYELEGNWYPPCSTCGHQMYQMLAAPNINIVTYIDGRTKRFQQIKELWEEKKAKVKTKLEEKK